MRASGASVPPHDGTSGKQREDQREHACGDFNLARFSSVFAARGAPCPVNL
jgi:hypothetical protein